MYYMKICKNHNVYTFFFFFCNLYDSYMYIQSFPLKKQSNHPNFYLIQIGAIPNGSYNRHFTAIGIILLLFYCSHYFIKSQIMRFSRNKQTVP